MRFLYLTLSLAILATVAFGQMNSECLCTKELMPVCYGDTRFNNRCLASCAGISEDLLTECTNNNNNNNNNDNQNPEIDEPAACICPMMFDPVCFNGKRYGNKCLAACDGVTATQLESCNNGIDPVPPGDDDNQDNNGEDEGDDKPNCAVVDCPNFSAPFCGPDEVLSSRPLNACCNVPACVKKPDVVDCSTVRCGYFRMAFPAKECPEGQEWQAVTTPPKCCPDHYECVRSEPETNPEDPEDPEDRRPNTCYDYGRNRVVEHGEIFSVDCNTCTCFDGDVSCTMMDCSSTQLDCRNSMNMCQTGYQCVAQEVQCIRAPCNSVFACVPIPDFDAKDCYASPFICGAGGLTSCALSYQCGDGGVDGTTPETCKKVGTCQNNLFDQSTPHFMCKGQKCAVLRVGIVNTDRKFSVNSVNTCSLLQDLFVKPKNRESLSFSCSTYINQPVAMAARDGHDQREKEEEENPAPSNFILIAVESTKCSRSAAKVIKHMKEQFSSGLLQVNYPETLSYFTADNVDIVAGPEKDNDDMSSFRAFLARVARYAGFGSLVVCAVGFLVFLVAHCYYKREARIAAAGGSGSGKCCNNKNRCVFSRMMIATGLKKPSSLPSYEDHDSNNDKVALTKAYFAGTESTGSFAPAPFSSSFSNNHNNNNNNNGKKGGDYKPLESVVFKMDDTPKSESNL